MTYWSSQNITFTSPFSCFLLQRHFFINIKHYVNPFNCFTHIRYLFCDLLLTISTIRFHFLLWIVWVDQCSCINNYGLDIWRIKWWLLQILSAVYKVGLDTYSNTDTGNACFCGQRSFPDSPLLIGMLCKTLKRVGSQLSVAWQSILHELVYIQSFAWTKATYSTWCCHTEIQTS